MFKKAADRYDKKKNKKISILLYIILLIALFGLFYTPYNELALFSILVVSNVSLLMYIGIAKERGKNDET